jgi:hypothetical protein
LICKLGLIKRACCVWCIHSRLEPSLFLSKDLVPSKSKFVRRTLNLVGGLFFGFNKLPSTLS